MVSVPAVPDEAAGARPPAAGQSRVKRLVCFRSLSGIVDGLSLLLSLSVPLSLLWTAILAPSWHDSLETGKKIHRTKSLVVFLFRLVASTKARHVMRHLFGVTFTEL